MIVQSLINLSALVNTTHITIKQKDWVLVVYFHHCCSMAGIILYAGLPTSTLPAAHLMHACSTLLPEASTHLFKMLEDFSESANIDVQSL